MVRTYNVWGWLKCRLGSHDLSSYAEALGFKGPLLVKLSERLGGDIGESFLEVSALRCTRCPYTFRAKTKTDWTLIDNLDGCKFCGYEGHTNGDLYGCPNCEGESPQ